MADKITSMLEIEVQKGGDKSQLFGRTLEVGAQFSIAAKQPGTVPGTWTAIANNNGIGDIRSSDQGVAERSGTTSVFRFTATDNASGTIHLTFHPLSGDPLAVEVNCRKVATPASSSGQPAAIVTVNQNLVRN